MGGSSAMQFLYAGYHTNLLAAVTGQLGNILAAVALVAQPALFLYIIILGKKLLFDATSLDQVATKVVRAIVVSFLLAAANYQTWVATPITTTVPDWITNTVTGSTGLAGAQGYDALVNQVHNFTAQIRAQAIGPLYIGDRVVIWLSGELAGIIIVGTFFIWMLANATVDFLVPLGAVLLPFYLFDTTRAYFERWYGKVIALLLVQIVTLMLGQVVVFQNAQYMQKYATAIAAARQADNGLMLPDTDMAPFPFGPATTGADTGSTLNVDAGIDMLGNIIFVFFIGFFLMIIVTGIALYIGGSSGFSAAPAMMLMTRTVSAITPRGRR